MKKSILVVFLLVWILACSWMTSPLAADRSPTASPAVPGSQTSPPPPTQAASTETLHQTASTAALDQTATPTPTLTIPPTSTPTATPTPQPIHLIGAGDIAVCGNEGDKATAKILAGFPEAIIFTAGDNSNDFGRLIEYQNCFGPTWGQYIDRMYPSPGNHDYETPGAPGYYTYFGSRAGDPKKGYYSYDLGDWHIIALNSNCAEAGGCGIGSPQEQWLRADLQNSNALCTLAYWHHPRWSSGLAGNHGSVSPLWKALVEFNAEIVVSGHDHHYEVFLPQNGTGTAVPDGLRQFIVGTGGAYLNPLGDIQANSELRQTNIFGILSFKLYADYYEWEFISIEGETFTDSGYGNCY